MSKPRCKNCIHFYEYSHTSDDGECRRYPPQTSYSYWKHELVSGFPQVEKYKWCSEWADYCKIAGIYENKKEPDA